jgi:hypothetical protein
MKRVLSHWTDVELGKGGAERRRGAVVLEEFGDFATEKVRPSFSSPPLFNGQKCSQVRIWNRRMLG